MSLKECCSRLPTPVIAKSESRSQHRINPMDVMQGVRISWAFNGLTDEHKVRFFLRGPQRDSQPLIFQQSTNENGVAYALLPPSVFASFVGQQVELWSDVTQDGCPIHSSILRLHVKRFKQSELPEPEVLDRTCEDCTQWLDLRQLPGDARMRLKPWPLMNEGQLVWVTCIGQRTDKEFTLIHLLEGQEVTPGQVVEGLNLNIPRWWLDLLMDGSSFEVKVAVSFDGSACRRRAHRFPGISEKVRLAPIDLPAPRVDEASAGELDPHAAAAGATVSFVWPGLRPSDRVCVHWGNDTALACQTGASSSSLTFAVPVHCIGEVLGQAIKVWCTVVRDGHLLTSPSTELCVLKLTRLPSLTVEQANAGVLDLNAVAGDVLLKVAQWDFARAQQPTWLTISGESENGVPCEVNLRIAKPLSAREAKQGIADILPREMLQAFADATEVHLQFRAGFEGTVERETAQVFPPLTLKLITQRISDTEDFTGLPNELVTEGNRIVSAPMMGIEFLSGNGQAGISTYPPVRGMKEGPAITLCYNLGRVTPPQRVQLKFKFRYLQMRFAWTHLHWLGKIFFYDGQEELGLVELKGADAGGSLHQWVEYQAPEGKRINNVVIEAEDYSFLSQFTAVR